MGVAAAIAGAAVVGAGASIYGSSKAAKAQKSAAKSAAQVQQDQYNQTRADYAPYREVGNSALSKLAGLYGLAQPSSATNWAAYVNGNPDALANWNAIKNTSDGAQFNGDINAFGQYHYTQDGSTRDLTPYQTGGSSGTSSDAYGGFETSPGYQFRVDEATKAIERSAAARGALASGATMKSLNNTIQGVASSEYGNYVNELNTLAGLGSSATSGTAAAGSSTASGISNAYTNYGNASASGYTNTANAVNSGVQNIASAYLYGNGAGWFGNGSGANMTYASGNPTGGIY